MNSASKRSIALVVGQGLLAGAFLAGWELASAMQWLDPVFFSRPSDVAARVWFWAARGTLWPNLLTTLVEAALSFLIGSALGVLVGLGLARTPFLADLLQPFLRACNALPRVVLAPVFLLWFGLGIWSKVALGVTVVFFVVFFNAFRGAREVDPVIVANARLLGASERQLMRHVFLPSALSWIFSSLHVSIGLAIIAVVVGEYILAAQGLGCLIAQAEGTADTTGVFAGMTVLAVGVLLVGALVNACERRLVRWQQPDENAAAGP
jgi:NitT/TauT family transport system permease protein